MQFVLTTLVFLVIVIMLVSINLLIFRAKWKPFFKSIYLALKELIQNEQQEDLTQNENNEKQPFILKVTWRDIAMFPLFIITFFVFYFVATSVQLPFAAKNPVLLPFMIVGALIILVLGVLGYYEKNIRRKFWMELIITLALEFVFVSNLSLLLNGYYNYHPRLIKNISSLFFIGAFFLTYVRRTQHNWKIL